MRRQLLCGALGVFASVALAACQPYYYGAGYYGYGGYQYPAYGYGPYGYSPYGAYPPPPPPYGMPQYAPPQAAVPQSAPPQSAVPQSLPQTSQDFVANMTQSASYEIEASRLAAQRSGSPQIRRFAERLIAGNTSLNQGLAAAMQRSGIPPTAPPALDPGHQAMIGDLSAVQGPEFDRRYAVQQVTVHREMIAALQNYLRTGDNPALRQFALQTLPAAQAGLQIAQSLPGTATALAPAALYREDCYKGLLWPFVRQPGDCPTDAEKFAPYRDF